MLAIALIGAAAAWALGDDRVRGGLARLRGRAEPRLLLVFRAVQGVGAAAALLTAFEVLHAERSRRLWIGASLIGTAAGPALGGVLTELFDWRAIFAVQVPLALAAAWTPDTRRRAPDEWPLARRRRSLAPLALTAAAFTAVLSCS